MRRDRLGLLAVLLLAMLTLSGCNGVPKLIFDPQDLYSLPTLPAQYTELNKQLTAVLDSGAEFSAPTSGTNIQTVQLVDLDGDGQSEAVAFFRDPTAEKPLKIYVFTARDGSYEQTDLIEGSGSSIYSIHYEDLDGDGRKELAVGWKATEGQQVLEVYTLRPTGAEVLVRTNYVKYITADLDQDQRQELVVLRADDEGEGIADYYSWQEDGSFTSQSSARISVTMAEVSQQGRVTEGTLRENAPAIFVTGVTDVPRTVTDILAVRNGKLSNIVLSELTGVSSEIALYCPLYPADINGDGLTEVPWPTQLFSPFDDGTVYQQIDWRTYDSSGAAETADRTYHALEDGWYFRLPEAWNGQLYVGRTVLGDEATVTFYIRREEREPEAFLKITAITGASREVKAARGGRFVLGRRQPGTIYTAELLETGSGWDCGLTADQVRAAFSLIPTEWIAGDT
ncbi:VCBS repeat-containing protein [uncultured Dysosmobacter sp.]|uniref:FG-GAP repeat domain-containing protein n=1 Tax=uncultured Dysosmobacter sp. TaxID=2591384 RepID=UPI0026286256|nr:VCBS repeat-containing protein [uncultured Dysosmobacter sp.]